MNFCCQPAFGQAFAGRVGNQFSAGEGSYRIPELVRRSSAPTGFKASQISPAAVNFPANVNARISNPITIPCTNPESTEMGWEDDASTALNISSPVAFFTRPSNKPGPRPTESRNVPEAAPRRNSNPGLQNKVASRMIPWGSGLQKQEEKGFSRIKNIEVPDMETLRANRRVKLKESRIPQIFSEAREAEAREGWKFYLMKLDTLMSVSGVN